MEEEENIRVDFSAHALVNPFDTIKNSQESFATLKKLSELGFSKVLLTPRYIKKPNTYASVTNLKKQRKELEVALRYSGANISLGVASEIFITPDIGKLIFSGNIILLSRKNILIKLPEQKTVSVRKIKPILESLVKHHYVPILMCPEKCACLWEQPDEVKNLSAIGVMFACSFKSICGMNGRSAERLMSWMLRNGYCDLLATETSSADDEILTKFAKAEKKVLRLIGKDSYEKIMRSADGIF